MRIPEQSSVLFNRQSAGGILDLLHEATFCSGETAIGSKRGGEDFLSN